MLVLIVIIAAVILAAFWKPLLKVIIAALVVGFVFMCITSMLDIMHSMHH